MQTMQIEQLPIDDYMEKIMDALRTHQVVIVEAQTGAGKSTRILPAVMQNFSFVLMTQPRRVAVRMIAQRIASELGCALGEAIGYKLAREKPVMSDDTRGILMVDRSLLNAIVRTGELPEGVIIVDEAHERSIDIDLIIALIGKLLPESPNTRLVITSATIDTTRFRQYFADEFGIDGCVVKVPGRCHPVDTKIVELLPGEHHTQGAARAARNLMDEFRFNGWVGVAGGTATKGAAIVLLPGKQDIADVADEIAAYMGDDEPFEVVTCSGKSTPEEMSAIQAPIPDGVLRFVIGTEVLRSSVTVEGAIVVIDTLQFKRMMSDVFGIGRLDKVSVSKAEADQGKGRAGRTAPGMYIMISFGENEYATLSSYPQPAMLREPLSSVLLQIAATGFDARDFPFIDRPDPEHVAVAIARLQKLGALDESARITKLGRTLISLSVKPELGKSLLSAYKLDVLPEAIIAAAALGNPLFDRPKTRTETVVVEESIIRRLVRDARALPEWITYLGNDPVSGDLYEIDCSDPQFLDIKKMGAGWVADEIRAQWAGKSKSDFVAVVRAYRAFKAAEAQLKTTPGTSKADREGLLHAWCVSRSINLKGLRLAELTMGQIRDDLKAVIKRPISDVSAEREFDAEALTKALLCGLFDNVAIRDDKQFTALFGDFTISHGSVAARSAGLVLVAGVRKTKSEKLFADMAAPVEIQWLEEMLPNLCETETGVDVQVDDDLRQATSVTRDWFNGLLVARDCVVDLDLTREIFSRLERAENNALSLHSRVSDIFKSGATRQLSDELYDRLARFAVHVDNLPTSVDRLEAWNSAAHAILLVVEARLQPSRPAGTQRGRFDTRFGR